MTKSRNLSLMRTRAADLSSPPLSKCRCVQEEVEKASPYFLTRRTRDWRSLREDEKKTQRKNREARPEGNGDRGDCAMDNYDGIAVLHHQVGFVKHEY